MICEIQRFITFTFISGAINSGAVSAGAQCEIPALKSSEKNLYINLEKQFVLPSQLLPFQLFSPLTINWSLHESESNGIKIKCLSYFTYKWPKKETYQNC